MPAQFILSLDCEGKWGAADHLTLRDRRELTDEKLAAAYRLILGLLDEYRMEATFAFVGAFAQSPVDFARLRPALEEARTWAPDYIGPALRGIEESAGAGWHGHQLVDLVTSARTKHEIGLHGVTHVPWTTMDDDAVAAEMMMFGALAGPVRASRTFVFPRNLVAHAEQLANHGFAGFRSARPKRSRALSLLAEFNVVQAPERPLPSANITAIPGGFFLNWRSGLRALVPPEVTRVRARRLLRVASANDSIVHYWLHPENIASSPSTLVLLRMLLREVAEAREGGHCRVMTQLAYCRAQESLR
jgi:peptidoglycan/xylan/chitin deacetylase (PgdA/CDA1 family)